MKLKAGLLVSALSLAAGAVVVAADVMTPDGVMITAVIIMLVVGVLSLASLVKR